MEAYRVYHLSNLFRSSRIFENCGISLEYSPVLAEAYSVTGCMRLDQSRVSEHI